MDPYIGEIRIFGGSFAPVGWAFCDGQLLSISDNIPLYRLIGSIYGGDGVSTFALPDLRGRLPLHMGNSSSGRKYMQGERAGMEQVPLLTTQLPVHSHQANAVPTGGVGSPKDAYWAGSSAVPAYSKATPSTTMAHQALCIAGSGEPHDNMMPSLGLSFIIALDGTNPPIS